MAGSAVMAIGGALAGAVFNKMMAPKPTTPAAPPAAPTTDPAAQKKASDEAASQARKRAQAAGGRSDTMLTGSQGLGEIGGENTQKTTLLGY